jgi:hypothetical protein
MTSPAVAVNKRIRAVWCASLITGLACCTAAYADPQGAWKRLDIRADAGFMFDDNVTRAKDTADIRSDHAYSVDVSKVFIFPGTEHTRTLLTGLLGGEKFVRYSGLSHAFGGIQGEFQYRSSAGFSSPTFAVFARAFAEQYESKLRDGSRYSAGVSMRQPVTDRIQLFGALAHDERKGESDVFDTKDDAFRLNLDYTVTRTGTLYLTGEYRRGDIVSTGQPTLELIDIARVFDLDDAFPGEQLYCYRFDGKTVIATLGYNIGFSSRHSLDISWRRIESTPDQRPSYATSPTSYVDNQYSIVYLVNF